jgi:hypothetical protein
MSCSSPSLSLVVQSRPQVRLLLKLLRRLCGRPRHGSDVYTRGAAQRYDVQFLERTLFSALGAAGVTPARKVLPQRLSTPLQAPVDDTPLLSLSMSNALLLSLLHHGRADMYTDTQVYSLQRTLITSTYNKVQLHSQSPTAHHIFKPQSIFFFNSMASHTYQ